jgi:GNAT superfamily N-acetyltransferase
MTGKQGIRLREYAEHDEVSWLRCRVLAFLGSSYYDDVVTAKPQIGSGVQFVATDGRRIVGLLDASCEGVRATIECIAVHPDFRRLGVASGLFAEAVTKLGRLGVGSIDAWTREDPDAAAGTPPMGSASGSGTCMSTPRRLARLRRFSPAAVTGHCRRPSSMRGSSMRRSSERGFSGCTSAGRWSARCCARSGGERQGE